jgi:hypothetical protein
LSIMKRLGKRISKPCMEREPAPSPLTLGFMLTECYLVTMHVSNLLGQRWATFLPGPALQCVPEHAHLHKNTAAHQGRQLTIHSCRGAEGQCRAPETHTRMAENLARSHPSRWEFRCALQPTSSRGSHLEGKFERGEVGLAATPCCPVHPLCPELSLKTHWEREGYFRNDLPRNCGVSLGTLTRPLCINRTTSLHSHSRSHASSGNGKRAYSLQSQ